jgi:hypothetical protein
VFRSRFTRSASIALAVTALGASTAGAMPADFRTPDAVDAGTPVAQTMKDLRTEATGTDVAAPDQQASTPAAVEAGTPATTTAGTDLRTPDAVDAGTPATAAAGTDLRTPDAVDHGLGRGTFSAPDVTVVKVVDPPPATGFDWGDAGIGAGGLLGLILVGLGGTLVVSHRRHSRMPLAS